MSFPARCAGRYSALLVLLWLALPLTGHAQFGRPAAPVAPPANAHVAAPVDLTGYWVALITEDWRYRMMTPDKGDYAGVPLNAAGRALAAGWDPARDEASGEQCKSYGAAAIMRLPTRLHISWQDDNTLRIDTDAGTQTRLLHFRGTPPQGGAPSLQGYSVASWEGLSRATVVWDARIGAKPTVAGFLQVVTTQLKPGYLRKNGVPYGAGTKVEEYFDSFKEPGGDTWLIVTSIVTDPEYLDQNFITSSQFKKIPDGSGWRPSPCEAR